ncbi:hypothetical protein NECAME_12759 [Necator americanus]|uniref:Uncharacterized protein n=1 Tax=Necator americanus TaxID=51031 RepID=W2SYV0_NECAM|nr:hypothetical protein NECAME_12759 [Necator americanus]ETN74748.1 hypothetical protein NECAME_12759 [Necator americanus]
MEDQHPLIQPTLRVTPSNVLHNYQSGDALGTIAREWPCSGCAGVLGIVHLSIGVILTLFDMLTSPVSNAFFAISAAILYIVCAILCFIVTR